KQVAAVDLDRQVVLWDLPSGKKRHSFEVRELHPSWAYSPDGRLLAVGDQDKHKEGDPGILTLWDARSGKRLWDVNLPGRPYPIAFTPDSRAVVPRVAGRFDFLSVADGKRLGRLPAKGLDTPTFSANGKTLALLANWGLALFDVASKERLRTIRFD